MLLLKQTQAAFSKAIYDNLDNDMLEKIKPNGIGNEERLQVYKDNVLITLYETLKSRYPAICKLVDEKFFKYAVKEYIKNNRPNSGNLDDYGESFIDFLAEFSPTKEFAYLPDVARLEWACHLAYFAADADSIDASSLSKVPQEKYESLTFTLHPSAHLISSSHPIDKLVEMTQNYFDGDIDMDLNERGADILVVRPEYSTEIILLEKGEYDFLTTLQKGFTLYEAFEKAAGKNELFDVGGAIQKFVANGTLVDFTPTQ